MSENARFGLDFSITGSINSGTGDLDKAAPYIAVSSSSKVNCCSRASLWSADRVWRPVRKAGKRDSSGWKVAPESSGPSGEATCLPW